ncbi:unnamed protein product [Heterobilharzia americana]|nr:unnamed protein product [Heterobilharzia americana]
MKRLIVNCGRMADKRKLQSDIERNLKRVQEGRTAFQEILDKFESSNNPTQKEKFEGDLKKEIKKLQRLRDQIKVWITANEVKDKRLLLEARKEIEQDMERFKVIEKETKTKAYSKEGLLSIEMKKDPLQKEKDELVDWLKQCIHSLNTQTEKYEFEIENLSNNIKKKRIDKEINLIVNEKRQHLEMFCFHIEKLETIMRLLDNERLDCIKVRSIQESIEYVIDCGDNHQSMIDFKNIYDDLCLDELGDSTGITAATTATTSGSNSTTSTTTTTTTTTTITANQEYDLNSVITPVTTNLTNHRAGSDDTSSSISMHTNTSNHTDCCSVNHPSSSTSSNASSSSRERIKNDEKVTLLQHISASSTSTPLKSSNLSNSCHKHKTNLINQTSPALMSQIVAGTCNKLSGKLNNTNENDLNTSKIALNISNSQGLTDDISRNQDINQTYADHSNTLTTNCLHLNSQLKSIPNDDITSLSTVTNSITPVINNNPSGNQSYSKEDSSVIPNRNELHTSTSTSSSSSSCETSYISTPVNPPSPIPFRSNKVSEANKPLSNTNVYNNNNNNNTLLLTSTDERVDNKNHTPPSLYSTAMLAASQDKHLSSLLTCSQHYPSLLRTSSNIIDPSLTTISLSNKYQSVSNSTSLSISSTIISINNPQSHHHI